jgi:uncharacterized metal-binding protein
MHSRKNELKITKLQATTEITQIVDSKVSTLIPAGAAMAANCEPCLSKVVPDLIQAGVADSEETKKEDTVRTHNKSFRLEVSTTEKICPVGEKVATKNSEDGKIPVLSCEGGCIRGEIARLAANIVAREKLYRRACHAELFTAPDSAMARWVKTSNKVVLIDGCFMGCHGRILENMISEEILVRFDALSIYQKYTDLFDIDDIPEKERKEAAKSVANWVIDTLKQSSAESGVKCRNAVDQRTGCSR